MYPNAPCCCVNAPDFSGIALGLRGNEGFVLSTSKISGSTFCVRGVDLGSGPF